MAGQMGHTAELYEYKLRFYSKRNKCSLINHAEKEPNEPLADNWYAGLAWIFHGINLIREVYLRILMRANKENCFPSSPY